MGTPAAFLSSIFVNRCAGVVRGQLCPSDSDLLSPASCVTAAPAVPAQEHYHSCRRWRQPSVDDVLAFDQHLVQSQLWTNTWGCRAYDILMAVSYCLPYLLREFPSHSVPCACTRDLSNRTECTVVLTIA